jgi:hypothetical protein
LIVEGNHKRGHQNMSFIRKHSRLVAIAVSCAVLGAGASAIAVAGAATGGSTAKAGKQSGHAHGAKGAGGGLRRLALRSVNGSLVVHTKQGFVTVSFERGKVASVSGQQLTINEGTRKASYKTVTLTIPANALVRDDRQTATLSDLKPGQRVVVIQAPKRTLVVARTPKH